MKITKLSERIHKDVLKQQSALKELSIAWNNLKYTFRREILLPIFKPYIKLCFWVIEKIQKYRKTKKED